MPTVNHGHYDPVRGKDKGDKSLFGIWNTAAGMSGLIWAGVSEPDTRS
jgi:hypothetical protein